jgi:periplasmic divalent cation tolerance protein
MTEEFCLVYMTAGSKDEAERIAETLVEERLAACVNLIAGMTSIYRWEGKIARDEEVVMIAKTRRDLVDDLTQRVKALHSYDIPCVVSIPIGAGNNEFLEWIKQETSI